MKHATQLTDSELVAEVTRLAHGERQATVALIVHLAEFDARRLFEGAGFSSTFKYCIEVLRLSEDAAFNRIEAARLARKYPAVLDLLVSGALSPTTARMLAKHLTPENLEELLGAASGKSKQEVERLLGAEEVRCGQAASRGGRPDGELTTHPCPCSASGRAPRWRLLRVRGSRRPSLRRTPLRRVPPRASLLGGWKSNRREHPAPLSRS